MLLLNNLRTQQIVAGISEEIQTHIFNFVKLITRIFLKAAPCLTNESK